MLEDARQEEIVVNEEELDAEVEGYAYCSSKKERCLNDCIWGIGGKASMVDIN
ncbi:MAG: hypothetical protein IKS48_10745 [Eubacterium sp.]|nr:hypothetical protein [Eubacterium sp.]